MPQNRRQFRQFQRRPNRGWSFTVSALPVAVPAASKVLLAALVPSDVLDLTILRTVGSISIRSDNIAGASEVQTGAFGIIPVTTIAATAGVASVPSPIAEADEDWFIYQGFQLTNTFISAIGVHPQSSHMIPFDSKAKRIIDGDGITMAVVVENNHATNAFEIQFLVRILAQIRGTG